jgi:hypothetical protein
MIKDLVILANDLDSKGLRAEADILDSLIKEGASTYDLLDYDARNESERKIAVMVFEEAERRANRYDISREMLNEFYKDVLSNVKKLIATTEKDMKGFDMSLALEESDEPIRNS